MAKHQIIYTSCMRGIDGVNDGQQIFSYDETFKDSRTDEVKSLFTYQVPSLPPGVLMSEEIAKTMPVAFMYRLLKNGSSAVTLNTYLGRDYMGSAGRFGNHLSHSIICDFGDFDRYPCEIYGGTVLRSSMEYEEVNNPQVPPYLEVPELTHGCVIEPDVIVEFLGVGDNMEYYKKMVTSMLRFSAEKKRIIICDEPENIVKWIAALHYTFPLEIAKTVSFTTYEFDPELSPSRICGVVSEGSKYNVSNYIMSNRHYVFDFINAQYSVVEDENLFLDFLDTVFSFSYDSLVEFHEFVMSKTTYRNSDIKYLAAYYLYNLLSEGIADVSKEQFEDIISFVDEYLTNEVKNEFINKLFEEQYAINQLENDYALFVLGYILKSLNVLNDTQQRTIKQMIVDRLLHALSTIEITETEFKLLYDNIDEMAVSVNFSLIKELIVQNNKNTLINVLSQNVEAWKVHFTISIISDYVKDMRVSTEELYPNYVIGAIYSGMVQIMYESSRQNGDETVEKILDVFDGETEYFVNMALNLDGILRDLKLSQEELEHLWNYFGDIVLKMGEKDWNNINSYLVKYRRYEEMYMLYSKKITSFSSMEDVRDYFIEYRDKWFKDTEYGQEYFAKALEEYEQLFEKKLATISEEECFSYGCEILNIAMELEVKEPYVETLYQTICQLIPLKKLSSDNKQLIRNMYRYQRDVVKKNIEGRLLLFVTAVWLNKIAEESSIIPVIEKIKEISSGGKAEFSGIDVESVKEYFEWAFTAIAKIHLMSDDFVDIFQVFQFKEDTHAVFMEHWCEITYKKSKEEKDYSDFAEFLKFMFEKGNTDDREMAGKYLCKLNKQKLEDLNDEMKRYFKNDKEAVNGWEDVKDIASSKNSLFNNLSNLFKRK